MVRYVKSAILREGLPGRICGRTAQVRPLRGLLKHITSGRVEILISTLPEVIKHIMRDSSLFLKTHSHCTCD